MSEIIERDVDSRFDAVVLWFLLGAALATTVGGIVLLGVILADAWRELILALWAAGCLTAVGFIIDRSLVYMGVWGADE